MEAWYNRCPISGAVYDDGEWRYRVVYGVGRAKKLRKYLLSLGYETEVSEYGEGIGGNFRPQTYKLFMRTKAPVEKVPKMGEEV